jgi:AcrR family transcriptional regulator
MASRGGTTEQILDAAIEAASIHGISRLAVGDVAARAGLSRQTLYRHFPSKDALVAAAVQREATTIIDDAVAAAAGSHDARSGLEAAALAVLGAAREHPLLDRIVRTEPETLLPLLTADGGPVAVQVRTTIETAMGERLGPADPLHLRRLADMVTRLLISYAVSAPDDPPEVVAASMADLFLGDPLVAAAPHTPTREEP